jgi:alpha-methylacyl-CoA racemase
MSATPIADPTCADETTGSELPLRNVKVIELGGIGPLPFAGMMLADLGADVVRIDRPGGESIGVTDRPDLLHRGKRTLVLDLKQPDGVRVVRELAERADILIEGWRPGVAERLGVGPNDCRAANPALVYGRMTGWGQHGPLTATAGHDISYIAITGALNAIGPAAGPPQIPLNLLGDYAGGALYLVVGALAALHQSRATGHGAVIDAAIVDGTAHLLNGVFALMSAGLWSDQRAANLLDGAAPYYAVYQTADEKYMAVGAIENRFYTQLLKLLDLDLDPALQHARNTWAHQASAIGARFRSRDQATWTARFAGTDACVSPVLGLHQAAHHPHLRARDTLQEVNGVLQAAPAPRFNGSPSPIRLPPNQPSTDALGILSEWKADGFR